MPARLNLCFAVALLMAVAGNARADSNKPSIGLAPQPGDNSASESATDPPTGTDAYNQAATTDPYNQPDFSAQQSFGLTASQMLGAAAACEQLHSDLVRTDGLRTSGAKDSSEEERANIDAAQQHMLDPAATSPGSGEADCDRVSGAFGQLQEIELHDQNLGKSLDQPDAMSSANSDGSNPGMMNQTLVNQSLSRQNQQPH